MLSNDKKHDLLVTHLESKDEGDDTLAPKRLSNVSVSKAVNMKLNTITNMVRYNLGRLPNTTLTSP